MLMKGDACCMNATKVNDAPSQCIGYVNKSLIPIVNKRSVSLLQNWKIEGYNLFPKQFGTSNSGIRENSEACVSLSW